jgi:hypothetical protein
LNRISGKLIAEIRKHYEEGVADGSQSVIHGWAHVSTVAANARRICRGEGGSAREQEIAYVAGLLHDYCREREERLKKEGGTDEHELESAEFARGFLPDKGFDKKFVDEVAQAILTHSFGISGVADDRGEGRPETLAAIALKVADKQQQAVKSVVWKRAQFLGECSGGNSTDEEMLAYVRKREVKLRSYLGSPEGRLLKKYFPESGGNLAFITAYNDELEREIKSARENPEFNRSFDLLGALGMMKRGQAAGAAGITVKLFVRQYSRELEEIDAKELDAEASGAYKFSKRMLGFVD